MGGSCEFFDCHSHWSTERGYIFQDPVARANQEKIWGTTAEFQTEQEMTDTFRKNSVRTVLDLALTVWMDDLDEIKAAHDLHLRSPAPKTAM